MNTIPDLISVSDNRQQGPSGQYSFADPYLSMRSGGHSINALLPTANTFPDASPPLKQANVREDETAVQYSPFSEVKEVISRKRKLCL